MTTHIVPLMGFIFFFTLAILMFTIHIPNNEEFKYYRKARFATGTGFLLLALVGLFRVIALSENMHQVFFIFSVRTMTSLLVTYLNYLAFFFLIEAPHHKRLTFNFASACSFILLGITTTCGLMLPVTQPIMSIAIGVIFIGNTTWMFVICLIKYYKLKKDLNNYYDDSPYIRWMNVAIYATYAISFMMMFNRYYAIGKYHLIFVVIYTVFYCYLSINLLNFVPKKIDRIRHKVAEEDAPTVSELEEKAEDKLQKEYYDSIQHLLEEWVEEKNYCTESLTIKDVASDLGTNHSYLSAYINKRLGSTFQVWMNGVRIEESKRLMLENPRTSIEDIANSVGYNQTYNFSRWFKQITGDTPFRWRQSNRSKA